MPYKVYFGWHKEKEKKESEQRKKSNKMVLAKFNKCNCIPIALFREIRKPLNMYFIAIALLSFTKDSPKHPFLQCLTVLSFILLMVAREILEDLGR